ncbi:hypothetical protein V8F33_005226 [Rhypophila sp. PSN 637]
MLGVWFYEQFLFSFFLFFHVGFFFFGFVWAGSVDGLGFPRREYAWMEFAHCSGIRVGFVSFLLLSFVCAGVWARTLLWGTRIWWFSCVCLAFHLHFLGKERRFFIRGIRSASGEEDVVVVGWSFWSCFLVCCALSLVFLVSLWHLGFFVLHFL